VELGGCKPKGLFGKELTGFAAERRISRASYAKLSEGESADHS